MPLKSLKPSEVTQTVYFDVIVDGYGDGADKLWSYSVQRGGDEYVQVVGKMGNRARVAAYVTQDDVNLLGMTLNRQPTASDVEMYCHGYVSSWLTNFKARPVLSMRAVR